MIFRALARLVRPPVREDDISPVLQAEREFQRVMAVHGRLVRRLRERAGYPPSLAPWRED